MTPQPRDQPDRRGGQPVDRRLGGELARGSGTTGSGARTTTRPTAWSVTRSPGSTRRSSTWPAYSRAFLGRAVTFLAGEVGIRQFLDVGSGLPGRGQHCTRWPAGWPRTARVRVRRQRPAGAVARPGAAAGPGRRADHTASKPISPGPSRPVEAGRSTWTCPPGGVVLINVLGHLPTLERAAVDRAAAAGAARPGQPPGGGRQHRRDRRARPSKRPCSCGTTPGRCPTSCARRPRSTQLFDGLELLEPGVVSCPHWRPHDPDPGAGRRVLRGRAEAPSELGRCGAADGRGRRHTRPVLLHRLARLLVALALLLAGPPAAGCSAAAARTTRSGRSSPPGARATTGGRPP